MKGSKGIYFWFVLFGVCFIAYQQVQDNIRPYYNGDNLVFRYLLGVAPNFFPAIGIPALFVIFIPYLKLTNKWLLENKHLPANFISAAGLISWEFIQVSSTKLHFDWNDVLWTFIGAVVFHLIWMFTPGSFKEVNP